MLGGAACGRPRQFIRIWQVWCLQKDLMLCCTRLILFDPVAFADSATTIYSLDLLGGRNYSASVGSPFNTNPVHVRARSRQHFRFTKPGRATWLSRPVNVEPLLSKHVWLPAPTHQSPIDASYFPVFFQGQFWVWSFQTPPGSASSLPLPCFWNSTVGLLLPTQPWFPCQHRDQLLATQVEIE